jgi:hypothetical protein
LTFKSPESAARETGLRFAGLDKRDEADFYLVDAWKIYAFPGEPLGCLTRWRIDSRTCRLSELAQYTPRSVSRRRFLYDSVNAPLPVKLFTAPRVEGQPPAAPEALDAGYTNRYVKIRDGSDGRMSLYWGKHGPKGASGSGLND